MNQHPSILRALVDERRSRYEARARRPKVERRRQPVTFDRHVRHRRRFELQPRRA